MSLSEKFHTGIHQGRTPAASWPGQPATGAVSAERLSAADSGAAAGAEVGAGREFGAALGAVLNGGRELLAAAHAEPRAGRVGRLAGRAHWPGLRRGRS